jgi:hypothetical protein
LAQEPPEQSLPELSMAELSMAEQLLESSLSLLEVAQCSIPN